MASTWGGTILRGRTRPRRRLDVFHEEVDNQGSTMAPTEHQKTISRISAKISGVLRRRLMSKMVWRAVSISKVCTVDAQVFGSGHGILTAVGACRRSRPLGSRRSGGSLRRRREEVVVTRRFRRRPSRVRVVHAVDADQLRAGGVI